MWRGCLIYFRKMTRKIKTRITVKDGTAELKILVFHPMESGLRKDAVTKKLIPRHFIDILTIEHNGAPVLEAHLSRSVSRNPFLHFKIPNVKNGDKFKIDWHDNFGEYGTIETEVT